MSKEYSAKEVSVKVLDKVLEVLKKNSLEKANTSHEIEPGADISSGNAQCPEYLSSEGKKKKKLEHEDAEMDKEVALDVMDEHNEEMHGEAEDVDSAYESEENEENEDEEEDEIPSFMKKGLDNLKEFLVKRESLVKADHIKGVHVNVASKDAMENKGISDAGRNARAKKEANKLGLYNKAKEVKDTAKRFHSSVAEEIKDIKPNLPKSECEMKPTLQKEVLENEMQEVSKKSPKGKAKIQIALKEIDKQFGKKKVENKDEQK